MRGKPVVLRASRASLASVACHRHHVSVAMAGNDDTCHLGVTVGHAKQGDSYESIHPEVSQAKGNSLRNNFLSMGKVVAKAGSHQHRNKSQWLVVD